MEYVFDLLGIEHRYVVVTTQFQLGMHRISGWIILPFYYPVCGRIPDCPAGYSVRPDNGYPTYV
jgi:hypothetical protein